MIDAALYCLAYVHKSKGRFTTDDDGFDFKALVLSTFNNYVAFFKTAGTLKDKAEDMKKEALEMEKSAKECLVTMKTQFKDLVPAVPGSKKAKTTSKRAGSSGSASSKKSKIANEASTSGQSETLTISSSNSIP